MENSELLRIFADANRQCGYKDYANFLEDSAATEEAKEIIKKETEHNQ